MARYKIKIKINTLPTNGNTAVINDSSGALLFTFTFYGVTPIGINPVEIGSNILQTVTRLDTSFYDNYNLSGTYIQSVETSDTLVVEGEFNGLPQDGGSSVSITTTFETASEPLEILSAVGEVNSTNQCNLATVRITTSRDITEILQPTHITGLSGTVNIIPDLARGEFKTIEVKALDAATASTQVSTAGILNAGLIDITTYGNSITITNNTSLDLEYSINGSTWQSANVFNDLSEQTYTLYIKDDFGCTVTKEFEIELGSTIPVIPEVNNYFLYPKANPVRVSFQESWDNCIVNKNDKNTLSCQTIDKILYREKQLWRSCDKVKIQVKSNYDDLSIRTTDNNQALTLSKITNNIGLKAMYDAKTKQINDTQVGIYFVEGSTYDYDTEVADGTYELNGDLPVWAKEGNVVTINSVNYLISGVYFDEILEYNMIVINTQIADGDTQVKCQYNLMNYDVFEVTIDMQDHEETQVSIFFNGKIQLLSEIQRVDNDVENLALIRYSMSYNTDMYWASGIEHIMRLIIDTQHAISSNESEQYTTDTDSVQTSSKVFEIDEIVFSPKTKEVTRIIELALSHDRIDINGIGYTKKSVEWETLDRSNLYSVTAQLYVRESGLGRNEFGVEGIEVPELININNEEFIRL